MAKLEGARKAQLLDKIEDAMWDVLDEGSFGWGVSAVRRTERHVFIA